MWYPVITFCFICISLFSLEQGKGTLFLSFLCICHQLIPDLTLNFQMFFNMLSYIRCFIFCRHISLILSTCSNLDWFSLGLLTPAILDSPLPIILLILFASVLWWILFPGSHVFFFLGLLPYFGRAHTPIASWERVVKINEEKPQLK